MIQEDVSVFEAILDRPLDVDRWLAVWIVSELASERGESRSSTEGDGCLQMHTSGLWARLSSRHEQCTVSLGKCTETGAIALGEVARGRVDCDGPGLMGHSTDIYHSKWLHALVGLCKR